MEHPSESFVSPCWRVWQVLGHLCGSPCSPSSSSKTSRAFACELLSRCRCRFCPSAARFDDEHCRCSRLCGSRIVASESLGNVAKIRVFGLVTLELFRQLWPYLRIPQQAVQGTEPPPRRLTSVEVFRLAIMWRVSTLALGLPDVDPLLASLTVPQNLLVSGTNRQVNESPKNKVIMSTTIDQQERRPL